MNNVVTAIKRRISKGLLSVLSRLMKQDFILSKIDENIFSDMLRRHFEERGQTSVIISEFNSSIATTDFARRIVAIGLSEAFLQRKMEESFNWEMMTLLKHGFRSTYGEVDDLLADLHIEMINARLETMPLGRSIVSSETKSRLYDGEHIEVMKNSIISANSIIGDYTYIGYNCLISESKIGRYCSIANNVSIGPGEHQFESVSTSSVFQDDAYAALTSKSCTIANDVWIGANAVIRRGVKIGNGVVVGANSFVNTDVPDFAVVAGSPARIIKFRFNRETQEIINRTGWWEKDLDSAKAAISKIKLPPDSFTKISL